MRFRLGMAVGFGLGYYLGAKAGNKRYEQMERLLEEIRSRPIVQDLTARVRTGVGGWMGEVRGRVEGATTRQRESLIIDLRDQISGASGRQRG